MPSLAHYVVRYHHGHKSSSNKTLQGVGIPLTLAGIILLILTKWAWGAGLFGDGWAPPFLGHRIEGNHPAFFQGLIYLLVGPIWVAKESRDVPYRNTPFAGLGRHIDRAVLRD